MSQKRCANALRAGPCLRSVLQAWARPRASAESVDLEIRRHGRVAERSNGARDDEARPVTRVLPARIVEHGERHQAPGFAASSALREGVVIGFHQLRRRALVHRPEAHQLRFSADQAQRATQPVKPVAGFPQRQLPPTRQSLETTIERMALKPNEPRREAHQHRVAASSEDSPLGATGMLAFFRSAKAMDPSYRGAGAMHGGRATHRARGRPRSVGRRARRGTTPPAR